LQTKYKVLLQVLRKSEKFCLLFLVLWALV
jgi:hypothetical protein